MPGERGIPGPSGPKGDVVSEQIEFHRLHRHAEVVCKVILGNVGNRACFQTTNGADFLHQGSVGLQGAEGKAGADGVRVSRCDLVVMTLQKDRTWSEPESHHVLIYLFFKGDSWSSWTCWFCWSQRREGELMEGELGNIMFTELHV